MRASATARSFRVFPCPFICTPGWNLQRRVSSSCVPLCPDYEQMSLLTIRECRSCAWTRSSPALRRHLGRIDLWCHAPVWCSVLQCVAMCCNVFQCVVVCCSVLQCDAVCWSVMSCRPMISCTCVLQCVAVCCNVLQCVAVCWSVMSYRPMISCTWVMSHVYQLMSRVKYMGPIWMRHVTYELDQWCHAPESCRVHKWMSPVRWISHIWMRHVTYELGQSCHAPALSCV